MICEVAPGMVSMARLTAAQSSADDGTLAKAMAGYARMFAWRLDADPGLRASLKERRNALRDYARDQGHPRTALNISSLALGWDEFLGYALQAGAITADERDAYWQRAWKALCDLGADQGRYARDADPVAVYLRALFSLVTSGRAHLAWSAGGSPPPGMQRWGWRVFEYVSATGGLAEKYDPCGECIGWTDGSSNVFLDPDAAYKAAVQFAEASGEPIGKSKGGLHKMLAERGLLATRADPGHYTAKYDLGGKTGCRVLHLTVRSFDSGAET